MDNEQTAQNLLIAECCFPLSEVHRTVGKPLIWHLWVCNEPHLHPLFLNQAGAQLQLLMVAAFHLLCIVPIQEFFMLKRVNLNHLWKDGDDIDFGKHCFCKLNSLFLIPPILGIAYGLNSARRPRGFNSNCNFENHSIVCSGLQDYKKDSASCSMKI